MGVYMVYYYNSKSGLYARKTKQNNRYGSPDSAYSWKRIEALPKKQRTKIQLLDLCEEKQAVEGVGRRRKSAAHIGFYQYFLYKDVKESEYE
jgi:hypothetical protein